LSGARLYNEKLLLVQISGGSERAFRAIYDAYFPRLSGFCFKLCKSETATEEIVQEVFVNLWTHRSKLADLNSVEAYLFSMTRNRVVDYFRLLAKQAKVIQIWLTQRNDGENEIDQQLDSEALQSLIADAINQLSPQKKRIFELSREKGLSHDEIAEMLQLSKSTVKNHLSETLQYLRKHLAHAANLASLLLVLAKVLEK